MKFVVLVVASIVFAPVTALAQGLPGTQAQINALQAQINSLRNGAGLLGVDGAAGLAGHTLPTKS